MFIERLQRELAITQANKVEAFLAADPGRWHVVSIREAIHAEAVLSNAKSAHAVVFEDSLTPQLADGEGPQPAHLEGILQFVANSHREPLLFQCWAGRSRSTAVALVVIVKVLYEQGLDGAELVQTAVDILLNLRPHAVPNRFVLRLGLEQFLSSPLPQTLSTALMREPRIKKNFL